MREIPLTQGKVALVDDEDYDMLIKWKWYAHRNRYTFYAARHTYIDGKVRPDKPIIRMHREILGLAVGDKRQADHKDQNGLHNWRGNLRIASPQANRLNQKLRVDNTSGYRGTYWHKRHRRWCCTVSINKKQTTIGYFHDKISAAKAYDRAAIKYYGENAILNFPERNYSET